jgi:hypothetical protein
VAQQQLDLLLASLEVHGRDTCDSLTVAQQQRAFDGSTAAAEVWLMKKHA